MNDALIIITIALFIALMIAFCASEVARYRRLGTTDIRALDVTFHNKRRVKSDQRVVVSMTSTPDRIDRMMPTLNSLLDQSVRVDEIILNIPYVNMKGKDFQIPHWMNGLLNIVIRRVKIDEGPATKLLPTLRSEDQQTRIVVVDDDVIYHSRTVERIVAEFERHNGTKAISNYGVRINGKLKVPTSNYSRAMYFFTPKGRRVDLLQGFSGFVVCGSLFPENVYRLSEGPEEAKSVDDVWFSGWLGHNNVDIHQLRTCLQLPLPSWDMRKNTVSLSRTNPGFRCDDATIQWFAENTEFRPLVMRVPTH